MEPLLNYLNYVRSPVCYLQGGRLWRLAEAFWRWSPIHQASASHRLGRQLVGKMGNTKECWQRNQQVHSVLFSKASLLSQNCFFFFSFFLVGLCLRPVLGEVHSGPGCAAAGGRGADRAIRPESAHLWLVALWLIEPGKHAAQTEPHRQALPMVCC